MVGGRKGRQGGRKFRGGFSTKEGAICHGRKTVARKNRQGEPENKPRNQKTTKKARKKKGVTLTDAASKMCASTASACDGEKGDKR